MRTCITLGVAAVLLVVPAVLRAAEPAAAAGPVASKATLSGDTNRPEMSLFRPGEPVELRFTATGLSATAGDLKLKVRTVDEQNRTVDEALLPVQADAGGTWRGTVPAPREKLGFYRVYAKLPDGTELAPLGSRKSNCLTYAIVPDPAQRPLYPAADTFFGMQGGFSPKVNILPYLGIRWVLGGYTWNVMEPKQAGEFVAARAAAKAAGKPLPGPSDYSWCKVTSTEGENAWMVYQLPTLYFATEWAVLPETKAYCTGTLTPAGETAWRDYCLAVGKAGLEDSPQAPERCYQITWEPVYPWGFKGTDEQLIRIHEIAFRALHEADPAARALGPTGASLDPEWTARLLHKGLGKWLDGFSVHPYNAVPPETEGFITKLRRTREVIRQETGRELPFFGTEQGSPTKEDVTKELDQARGLIRQNLIMLGEGARLNFAFYIADYPGEPGYGYCYNLNPKIAFGTDKVSPKPIAPAYAAQSFLLEGSKTAGAIEWLGDTALGYAFERPDNTVLLALWDFGDAPREVTLPVGVPAVEVYDWMGNRTELATAEGSLTLTLTPEPVYVNGVAPKLWGRNAVHPLRLEAPRMTLFPGTARELRGSVTAGTGQPINGILRLETDPRLKLAAQTQPVEVKPGRTSAFSFSVALPPLTAPGNYAVKLTLRENDRAITATGAMLRLQPPLQIASVKPGTAANGRKTLGVELLADQAAVKDATVRVRLAGVPESTAKKTVSLKRNRRSTVPFSLALSGLDPARIYPAEVTVTLASGFAFTETFPVSFLPAVGGARPPALDGTRQGWDAATEVRLAGLPAVVRSPEYYTGRDDLAASLRFAWDAEALYLFAEVEDDVFFQDNTGFNTWKGDCIQIDFDLDPSIRETTTGNELADAGNRKKRHSEIDLALTAKGPEVYRTLTFNPDRFPVRLLTAGEASLSVTRNGNRITYAAALPWKTLGATTPPKAGDIIGLGLTVNDMDDAKQLDPSALGLFGGIVPKKDPAKFGMLILGETR